MTAEQEDTAMSGTQVSSPVKTEPTAVSAVEKTNVTPTSPDEERAAKRLKTGPSAPSLEVDDSAIDIPISKSTSTPTKDDSKTTTETKETKSETVNTTSEKVPEVATTSNTQSADGAGESKPETANGNDSSTQAPELRKGTAPIKKEYLITVSKPRIDQEEKVDDDAAEARSDQVQGNQQGRDRDGKKDKKGKRDKKDKGQNTQRQFGQFDDTFRLCHTRAYSPEFSPLECRFGDKCRQSHDLRKYLAEGRRDDLQTFDGKCPVFTTYGKCSAGWKCRFVGSHMREIEHEDGRKELVLIDNTVSDEKEGQKDVTSDDRQDLRMGVYNVVETEVKFNLSRKKVDFAKSDEYVRWTNEEARLNDAFQSRRNRPSDGIDDLRAQFVDPPFKASEKRRLYFGPETPALAPLTTQGNLPFRRLCVELGAELTYSEMAVGQPLVQGAKADWTLLKAHESEIKPPLFKPAVSQDGTRKNLVVDNYDNSRDLRFGAQISASVPWVAIKAADVLTRYCPHLRLVDLNCGCPIDMIYKSGGGSALLTSGGKLERMIRGMNAVSGDVPITAKIRTGVKQNQPTAQSIIGRLAFGGREHRERLGAPGCAAITLHGRSREQRYTKKADWSFIGDCAALIKSYNQQKAALTDTAAEPDESTLPNSKDGRMYFLGNGDCYSHVEYFDHIENARVDSVMIGRGALIKPWLFEEIEKGQYLDKSASERLTYIEKFVRYGLEAWGSDELGIGYTRRFLCEWLSFAHRYVPIGLLERLPPDLNDRPPAYQGRNDLETLMASGNYKDWVKISEMFLGPVQDGFKFQPKHKSNAYEAEG